MRVDHLIPLLVILECLDLEKKIEFKKKYIAKYG